MDRFKLKIIMIIFMLLDHIGYYIDGTPAIFRYVGRVVAPVFIFLLVEGYIHTKNRMAYLKRLVLGSQVMFIGSTILNVFIPRGEITSENKIFLLALVLVNGIMLLLNYKNNELRDKKALIYLAFLVIGNMLTIQSFNAETKPIINNIFLSMALSFVLLNGLGTLKGEEGTTNDVVRVMGVLALSVFSEGALMVPAIAYVFYRYRDDHKKKYILFAIISVFFLPGFDVEALLKYPQWMMVFAIIFMVLYNGKEGKKAKWMFYIFYPLHIWILYLISIFI